MSNEEMSAAGPDPRSDADSAPEANGENGNEDETVPQIELGLYQATVTVRGRSDNTLDDVESSARRLMDYLVEAAEQLDDDAGDRGLG